MNSQKHSEILTPHKEVQTKHSFTYLAINQKYNNSIQKYITDNIQYSKDKEAYIEAGGL